MSIKTDTQLVDAGKDEYDEEVLEIILHYFVFSVAVQKIIVFLQEPLPVCYSDKCQTPEIKGENGELKNKKN